MVSGSVAGAGLLMFLAMAAGCGSATRALGTGMDGGPDQTLADAVPVDAPFDAGPIFEIGLDHVRPCGNGVLDPGEECDDANRQVGDGCSQFCTLECPAADPSCRVQPQPPTPICGDGVLAAGEACDDGNADAGDGCRSDCSAVEAGWTCAVPGRRCFPICGDGVVTAPETCDDGNQQSGDGCSSSCEREGPCFATDGSPAACPASCGNGRIDGSEECDDGPANTDTAGACSTTCHRLHCGDGIVTPPETCDLGPDNEPWTYAPASRAARACSALCTTPHYCGDGVLDLAFGEECDLGSGNGKLMDAGGQTCVICGENCILPGDC